jgi:carbonic anhydrase/acetyltransferase-like protein (isoleucine patch superfamily)
VRPNTPVLPFAAPLSSATFLDPTSHILNGAHVVVGTKSYVGPYASLDATTGFIKIGTNSAVLDNATVIANPNHVRFFPPSVIIGDAVEIGYGATVLGGSTIGAFGSSAKDTGVGANAVIDGATIEPGAVVGALARVGPGVTVPSGFYVLPSANVTTNAEASDPALGKVEKVPSAVATTLQTSIARNAALAAGYTNLYQGNSATGANPGTTSTTVFNGNLATVSGASPEPGAATTSAATGINFEPTSSVAPSFVGPFVARVQVSDPNFIARVTGDVRFTGQRVHAVERHLGRSNAIRGDQGQPITFATSPTTGRAVTIYSPTGSATTSGSTTKTVGGISVGSNLTMQDNAVLLGGSETSYKIGNDVTIGTSAVVSNSNIGNGVVIGARSYVANSTIAAGQVIAPGTILIGNKVVGTIQW